MMAQHVDHPCSPVALSFIFAIFHLAKGVVLSRDSTIAMSQLPNSLPLVDVRGRAIDAEFGLRWSADAHHCNHDNELERLWTASCGQQAVFGLQQPRDFEVTLLYFCYRDSHHRPWINLGNNFTVQLAGQNEISRMRRDTNSANSNVGRSSNHILNRNVRIEGLRIETADKDPSYSEEGIPEILVGGKAVIRLFGTGLTENTYVTFTDKVDDRNKVCDMIRTKEFKLRNVDENTALIDVVLPKGSPFFICIKQNDTSNSEFFYHQGTSSYITINTYEKLLPAWLSIIIIMVCLAFSALFSGLNLGLMAMDRTELKILCNTGTEKEKQYARTIQPVRNHGNYLLCSILFSNVLVNSIFTILLDDLTSGLVAVICSTLLIVIFGEITPQAVCSRHGLCVGAKTIYLTRITMLITSPLSFPISKVLDFLLGEEIGNVYNRERLKELVKVTNEYNDLEKDEVNIIAGALELRRKTVADVMTRIEDVYMLDLNSVLDFETVTEITNSGFSRIPIYDGVRTNIVSMLYIKDLAFVDPDDNTPLRTLCEFYQNPCNFVFEDTTLDIMFKQFKEGHKGHMAFVHRVNNEGEGDPFYEVMGLVTLEDVIEELIQAEIVDETDVFMDNRSKRKRLVRGDRKRPDFSMFAEKKESQRIHISPQLTLATFQYLSTSIEAFKPDIISETILRRLLKQDIIYHIKVKSRDKARNDPATAIYLQGKPVDYFVLILEGRVEVTVGRENLLFESGPFTYFGIQALTVNAVVAESPTNANPHTLGSIQSVNLDAILRHTFVPDFTVRAVTEVFYCKIKRSLYLAAKRATLLERSQKDPSPSQDQFDDEVEKLLHSLDEDDRSLPESPLLPKDKHFDRDRAKERDAQTHSLPTSPVPTNNSPIANLNHSNYGQNGKQKTTPRKVSITSDSSDVPLKSEELTERHTEAARQLSTKASIEDEEERSILLSRQDDM